MSAYDYCGVCRGVGLGGVAWGRDDERRKMGGGSLPEETAGEDGDEAWAWAVCRGAIGLKAEE